MTEPENKTLGTFREFEEEIVTKHCPNDPTAQLLVHLSICMLQFGIAFGRERQGLSVVTQKETEADKS